MTTARVLEGLALFLIGDGMMGLLRPRRHSLLWDCGPAPVRDLTETLAANRGFARGVYIAEVALGVLLACRETRGI